MIRALVWLLLTCTSVLASPSEYDALVQSTFSGWGSSLTRYMPLSVDATDSSYALGDGTCTTTCTYGIPVANNIRGVTETSAGLVNPGATFNPGFSSSTGLNVNFWVRTTNASVREVFIPYYADENAGYSQAIFLINDNNVYGGTHNGCGAGSTSFVNFRFRFADIFYQLCAPSIADGLPHMVSLSCGASMDSCAIYIDGVSRVSGALYGGFPFPAPVTSVTATTVTTSTSDPVGAVTQTVNAAATGDQLLALYNCGIGLVACTSGNSSPKLLWLNRYLRPAPFNPRDYLRNRPLLLNVKETTP